VVRKFLRDAGITSDAGAMLDAKKTLIEMRELELPFQTLDQETPNDENVG
jgi:hypothetical protein